MTWMNFIDVSGKKYHSPKNTNFRIPFIGSSRDCMTYLYQSTGYLGRVSAGMGSRKVFWGSGKFYNWIWVTVSQMCKYIMQKFTALWTYILWTFVWVIPQQSEENSLSLRKHCKLKVIFIKHNTKIVIKFFTVTLNDYMTVVNEVNFKFFTVYTGRLQQMIGKHISRLWKELPTMMHW